MSQQDTLELARQGNPDAIATLINRNLSLRGINAKVSRQDDCLLVTLESNETPSQESTVEFIRNGILKLGIAGINTLQVFGMKLGSEVAAWNQTITISAMTSNASATVRKAYQFLQIRVQLLGRGMTNEIASLYVNGKRLKPQVKTMHEFLNYLGFQGFCMVTAELETEGVYTHFYTMQREILTQQPPDGDIFDELTNAKEGADFGDAVKNLFEGGLDRLA